MCPPTPTGDLGIPKSEVSASFCGVLCVALLSGGKRRETERQRERERLRERERQRERERERERETERETERERD